jgi:hypothetical protein
MYSSNHPLHLSFSRLYPYSCVALRRLADAKRYLPPCCTTRPSAYMHVGSKNACTPDPGGFMHSSRHQPTHQERRQRQRTLQPSIAQQRQRQQTAPPECPDAVMVEWVKNVSATYLCYRTLSARVHLFQYATQQRRRSRCQH